MKVRILSLIASLGFVFVASVAFAQESTGALRMELSAAPGGGVVFAKPATKTDIDFSNYAMTGGFTYNINHLFGVEGEVGAGIGLMHSFATTTTQMLMDGEGNVTTTEVPRTVRTRAPRTLAYEGNLVYHPRGNDHALVPYATGGAGALTMFTRTELKPLGLLNTESFLTGNVGGGLKWFVSPGWGVRADYRFLIIKSRTDAPAFFGLNENRYGHRVYGSFIYTFGR
jgi:hypothetical protein